MHSRLIFITLFTPLLVVFGNLTAPSRAQSDLLQPNPDPVTPPDYIPPIDIDSQPVPPLPSPVQPQPLPQPLPPLRRSNGLCPADFNAAINQIIRRPTFAGARWGIMVESPTDQTPLYSYNAGQMLIPASNNKLFTTAAALKLLYHQSVDPNKFASRINTINQYSDNYASDLLWNQIGGLQRVRTALVGLGVDPLSFRQVDGSGLSRSNLATPTAIVHLLRAMYFDDDRKLFYYSLPLSGVSGTLKYRFLQTPLQAKVRAKTGTLSGVRALSGYMQQPDYGTLIFSIIVNQPGQSGDVLVNAVDRLALQMERLTPCS
uniref:Peptidase S13 D-Ala-D-Ala carboxypeptidase C n=1 Tax=Cyanothece sp. (strain PCC 7425 / ATCC 29141) TaxID=395961 RepID=B8HUX0_CYAP4